jgi:hypothetical protein
MSDDPTQALLDRARQLQDEYWVALSELESELGFDIDGTEELPSDVASLIAVYAEKE